MGNNSNKKGQVQRQATANHKRGSSASGSNKESSGTSASRRSGVAIFTVDGRAIDILELQHNIDRAASGMLTLFESSEIDPKGLVVYSGIPSFSPGCPTQANTRHRSVLLEHVPPMEENLRHR